MTFATIGDALVGNGWWIASRASGLVALVLVTISVGIGLAMAGKPSRPGLSKALLAVHEQTALAGLIAIGLHGATLLADPWLKPGVGGVTVPFALGYATFFTGLGVIAAYLALLLGLSFYARKRVGAKLWRKAHRATILVYLLGLVHALGAGSDASSTAFRIWAAATAVPLAALFVYRLGAGARLERRRRAAARARGRRARHREATREGQLAQEEYEEPLMIR
ncbi:MAG: ferric reductase-like transmembrane domain-containing protein [Solirubrobacterales bacterium]